jgi:hypothetical protein
MTMKMTKKTAERLVKRLVKELHNHKHRDEIVALATQQLIDDTSLSY